jgi:arylsulfatase A-like enzyme
MTRSILRIAVWCGLVTGLLEGVGFLALQGLGWLSWNRSFVPVSLDIIWVAAFLNLFVFGALGVCLAAMARWFPRLPMVRLTFGICALLAFYDWLALSGHLYRYAVLSLALGLAAVLTRWFGKHETTVVRFFGRTLRVVAAMSVLALVTIRGGQWLQERLAVARLPPAAAGAPNILVIVVDTLRADHLSTYGYARATSPSIDRLAQQGVLFENAISTSSWTLPSHASLVTGRYTYEHGAEKRPLDDRYLTIAEALRARGYRTGAFSANLDYFNRTQGFARGFIHFEDYFQSLADMVLRTLYGREARKYLVPYLDLEGVVGRKRAPDINRAVLRWLQRNRDKPFLAFLNYFDTHDPYLAPPPYCNTFATANGSRDRFPRGLLALRTPPTPEQVRAETDAYDGAILYMDHCIDQLLSELRQRGLLENTFIFFTSDHGESLGEHGLLRHQNALYRELIHVPLIIVNPGVVPAGVRVAQPVSNAALAATAMDFVGAGDQVPFPQSSLAEFWRTPAGPANWPSPIAELAQFPFARLTLRPSYYGAMKSVVSPQWHYIIHDKFGVQLYDWRNDPDEVHDLAQQPDVQDVVSHMAMLLSSLVSHKQAEGHRLSLRPVPKGDAAAVPGGS